MINVEVVINHPPLHFKLVNGVVFVYGGVFKIDNTVLDLDNLDDVVFRCLDLEKYNLNFSDYPCVLYSKNLYKRGVVIM